jgi:kinesin family protein 2/24
VHAAVISGINDVANTVTVEWFENEETKGKELDYKTVLSTNPDLAGKNAKGVERAASQAPTYVEPAAQAPASVPKKAQSVPPQVMQAPSSVSKAAARPTSATPVKKASVAPAPTPVAAAPAPKPPAPSNAVNAANAAAAKKGPSKTVLEIQKLEKQREERRAKQQEAVQSRDVRGGKDNVNLEFMQMIEDYRETVEQHPFDPNGPVSNQKITVCLRKRPLNKKELEKFDYDVITMPDGKTTLVHEPKTKVDMTKYLDNHEFHFDHAFDDDVKNSTVYRFTAAPLVKTIFEGGFATCFAYGQTGMTIIVINLQ